MVGNRGNCATRECEREKERERGGQKSGNMRIVYLTEPVNDIKVWLLPIIIRDKSYFVLTSKLSEWKGNHCDYYNCNLIDQNQNISKSHLRKSVARQPGRAKDD